MILKEKYKENPGFQYVIDSLELMSSVGRRFLLSQPFMTNPHDIEKHYDLIALFIERLRTPAYKVAIADLRHQLMRLHDLQGTLLNLQKHIVVDEIELFEIKSFAYLCHATRQDLATLGFTATMPLPDTQNIFDLLDPDKNGVVSFYLYDSYHPELGIVRQQLKRCAETDPQYNALFERQNELQQQVLLTLSRQLWNYADLLSQALQQMASIDILQAEAAQALTWNLSRPIIAESIHYCQLVNPRLKAHNETHGLRYQPIDICLQPGLCLITGANMAGKTVLLKSLSIAQLMVQFGMYAPAQKATIALVDDVALCIGDDQNEMNGLSSFASEITQISTIIERSQHERLLILIDEPARTTNPIEGKAIVQAVGSLLQHRNSFSVITTHYSQLNLEGRNLRVKGFVEALSDTTLSAATINQFMDYSLIESCNGEVPHEALRIAALLGCNADMIKLAEKFASSTEM